MPTRLRTRYIVVHCSATRPSQDIGVDQIREWHLAKGWQDIGYHFVVRRDGRIEPGRPIDQVGAHVAGHNADSVAICLVGGLDESGRSVAEAPYPTEQLWAAKDLVRVLYRIYPGAKVVGHRDLSPDTDHDGRIQPWEWIKTCPGINAEEMFA